MDRHEQNERSAGGQPDASKEKQTVQAIMHRSHASRNGQAPSHEQRCDFIPEYLLEAAGATLSAAAEAREHVVMLEAEDLSILAVRGQTSRVVALMRALMGGDRVEQLVLRALEEADDAELVAIYVMAGARPRGVLQVLERGAR